MKLLRCSISVQGLALFFSQGLLRICFPKWRVFLSITNVDDVLFKTFIRDSFHPRDIHLTKPRFRNQ